MLTILWGCQILSKIVYFLEFFYSFNAANTGGHAVAVLTAHSAGLSAWPC